MPTIRVRKQSYGAMRSKRTLSVTPSPVTREFASQIGADPFRILERPVTRFTRTSTYAGTRRTPATIWSIAFELLDLKIQELGTLAAAGVAQPLGRAPSHILEGGVGAGTTATAKVIRPTSAARSV